MKPATVCNCSRARLIVSGSRLKKGHLCNVQFIIKPKTEAFSFDGGTATENHVLTVLGRVLSPNIPRQ